MDIISNEIINTNNNLSNSIKPIKEKPGNNIRNNKNTRNKKKKTNITLKRKKEIQIKKIINQRII